MNSLYDKQKALEQFMAEHPEYSRYAKEVQAKLSALETKKIKRIARINLIVELKRRGKSFGEIGRTLGITRARAQQLFALHPDTTLLAEIKAMRTERTEIICPIDKVAFYVRPNVRRVYCSRRCFGLARRKYSSPEEAEQAHTRLARLRYQSNPNYRRWRLDYTKRWREERENQNPKLREERLTRMRGYYKKTHKNTSETSGGKAA